MKKYTMMASLLIAGIALKAQLSGLEMASPIQAAPVASSEQVSFILKVKIEEFKKPAKMIFEYFDEGLQEFKTDTVKLENGSVTFKGTLNKPQAAYLTVIAAVGEPRIGRAIGPDGEPYPGRDTRTVYLDQGTIVVKGKNLVTATITGSKSQVEFEEFKKTLKPSIAKLTALEEEIAKLDPNDTLAMEEINKKYDQVYMEEIRPARLAFIKSHPDSYVVWNEFLGTAGMQEFDKQKAVFDLFSERLKNSKDGKEFLRRGTTAVGQMAPDISMKDVDGNLIKLSSFKGKYLLLDFWASWCGPCRAENPNVKKAYEKFHDKNFEILAVSLDDKKDEWIKAIKEDGLPWKHVSDLKGWKNEAARLYGIQAVPSSWLIGPDGVIIARNLRGDALSQKLEELLK